MEVLIEIEKGGNRGKLSIKGASKSLSPEILTEFFAQFTDGRNDRYKEQAVIKTSTKQQFVETQKEQKSRSRQLPLIGASSNSLLPMGEIAKIKYEPKPEHWITGIKVDDDGTKRYRLHYWCSCGSKGKRYVPLETETIICRECEKELTVQPATDEEADGDIPVRDEFGNYFIAKVS